MCLDAGRGDIILAVAPSPNSGVGPYEFPTALQPHLHVGRGKNEATYMNTRFFVAQNLDVVQSALSGRSHSEVFANIECLLQFDSAPAAAQCHLFTHFDNVLEVKPTGQLERTY